MGRRFYAAIRDATVCCEISSSHDRVTRDRTAERALHDTITHSISRSREDDDRGHARTRARRAP
eukprot:SAG31_NODE_5735_length_2352_cov_6.368842_4_plen_63_part_01